LAPRATGDENARPVANLDETVRLELDERFAHGCGGNTKLARHRDDGRKLITGTELTILDRRMNPMDELIGQPLTNDGDECG